MNQNRRGYIYPWRPSRDIASAVVEGQLSNAEDNLIYHHLTIFPQQNIASNTYRCLSCVYSNMYFDTWSSSVTTSITPFATRKLKLIKLRPYQLNNFKIIIFSFRLFDHFTVYVFLFWLNSGFTTTKMPYPNVVSCESFSKLTNANIK